MYDFAEEKTTKLKNKYLSMDCRFFDFDGKALRGREFDTAAVFHVRWTVGRDPAVVLRLVIPSVRAS
jgi:hypothetical protein